MVKVAKAEQQQNLRMHLAHLKAVAKNPQKIQTEEGRVIMNLLMQTVEIVLDGKGSTPMDTHHA